jgi:type I restriction enzyme M protein
VTVERPLRLRSQFNTDAIDGLLLDSSQTEVSSWLLHQYGNQVYDGIEAHRVTIKEALQEQDIKLTDKKLDSLLSKKKWFERKQLRDAAQMLHATLGDEVYMDYNVFRDKIKEVARSLKHDGKIDLGVTQLEVIARAMSVTDPAAAPVIAKEVKVGAKELVKLMSTFGIDDEQLPDYGFYLKADGKSYIVYDSDSALRDTEKIPVKEDILAFFKREVTPYVPDAWLNIAATKVGCEISFNKYFYRPVPLRSLADNEADIRALEAESAGAIQSLLNLLEL